MIYSIYIEVEECQKQLQFVGTLIHVKPVLHVTNEGELKPFQNVRGRKKALQSLVDSMKKEGARL